MTEDRVRKMVTISPENHISREDLKNWGINLLKFTAPTLAVFFGQLKMGVPVVVALPVAAIALWGTLADFFSKYKNESVSL